MRIGQQRTRLLCLVWFSLHFGHRIFIFFLRSLNIFDFYLFFRFSLIKFICVDVVYVRVVASTESHSVRARQRTFMESRTNKFSFRIVRFAFRHVLQVFFFFLVFLVFFSNVARDRIEEGGPAAGRRQRFIQMCIIQMLHTA